MATPFLKRGNGHQNGNRKKAMAWVVDHFDEASLVDERTIDFSPFGRCHFAAYTHPDGAMISTPNAGDNKFGTADWHDRDRIVMFRDFGDGRCVVYVCPIKPLFDRQTIGHHGVRWEDVLKISELTKVFRTE